jgi:hypothetical protein
MSAPPIRLDDILKTMKGNHQMTKEKEAPKEQKTIDEAVETTATSVSDPEPASISSDLPAITESVAVEKAPPSGLKSKVAQVMVGKYGAHLESLDDLWRFAKMVSLSGFAPKGMEKPEAIAVAIQLGLEVGLSPMSALQNIASINGRPGIFGDAAKALVEASGLMEDFDEWYVHEGERVALWPTAPKDETAAYCMSKRNGRRERVTAFSVGDAKKAALWGKTGRDGQPTPWTTYPARMMMFRARGFNLRDNFPDVLKGVRTAEELQDIGGMVEVDETGPIEMPRRASETAAEEPQA